MKFLSKFKFVFAILSTIILLSCGRNQDEDVELELDTEVAVVEVEVEKTFNSIDDIADQAELGTTITKKTVSENDILTNCATVTKDTSNGATTDTINIVVDFGASDCLGDDNIKRRGKINITSIIDNSTFVRLERKIETEDYYRNGNQVSLERTFNYLGLDPQNNPKWKISMNASILFTDNRTITRNSDRIRTWTSGATTLADWTDDEYTIEGTETGTRIDGKTITSTTTKTLLVRTNCPYVVSGVLKIETSGKPDFSIDYGNGVCDDKATGSSLGFTWSISL